MTHRAAVVPPRDVDVTDAPASLGRRFLAVAVDQVLLGLLLAPFALDVLARAVATARAADPSAVAVAPVGAGALVGLALAALLGVAQWVLHGRRGWTLGRRLLGVRTVDVHSRRPVGLLRVLLRELVVAAGALACLVGQVAVLVSPALDRTGRNRGWHDRAVDAEVLVARTDVRTPRTAAPTASGATLPVSGPLSAGDPGAPVAPPDTPETRTGGSGAPGSAPVASPPVASPPGAARPAWAAPGATSAASSGPGAAARGAVPPTRPAGSVPEHPGPPPRTVPTTTGGLVLAPLDPARAAPDLDTRALPLVRAATPVPPPHDALGTDDADGLPPELELTRPAPPREDVMPAQRRGPVRGLRVALDDGRTLTVERVALLGRNPTPAPGVQVVRVTDPGRSVSKTHLELGADASGAWVTDRGSTNGTVVTLPDGAQVVCRVDHPVRLRPGAVVVLGDRSLRVVAVPGTSVADVLRPDAPGTAEGTGRRAEGAARRAEGTSRA